MWEKIAKNTSQIRTHFIQKKALFFVALLIGIFIPFFYASRTTAATRTWDGGGVDNNWSTCANWSLDTCPVAADSVIFDATSTKPSTIDASAPASIANLTISSGYTGTITLGKTFIVTGYSQADGTFTAAAQTLTMTTFSLSNGSFTASSGNTTVSSTFTISGGTFNHNSGTFIFSGGAATLSCGNKLFNLVSFAGQSSTKTVNSDCSLPLGASPTMPAALILNGTLSGTGTFTNNAAKTFNAGATLSGFSGIGATGAFTVQGANLDLSGYSSFAVALLTVSSGSLSLPATASTTGITLSGGTLTASSTNLTTTGTLNFSGSSTFNHNNGTVTIATNSSVTFACNNAVFNRVVITMTGNGGGIFNTTCNLPLGNNPAMQTGTVNNNLLTFQGPVSGTGTLTITAPGNSGVSFASTSSLTGLSGLVATHLSIATDMDWSAYTTFSMTGNLTLSAGSLSLPAPTGAGINITTLTISAGTFTASPGNMKISAGLTISGTPIFNHNNGSITFNGSATQTLSCNNVTFNSVIITKAGNAGMVIGSNCTLPLGANPTITNGDTNSNPFTLNGTLTGTGTLNMVTTAAASGLTIGATGVLSGFTGLTTTSLAITGATANFGSYSPLTASSSISISAGSLTLPNGTTIGGSLSVSGGTFTAPSGDLPIVGSLSISGTPTFNANGGSLTFTGNAPSFTCANVVFNRINLNFTGTATVNSGCTLPLGPDPTVPNGITLSGILSGTGTLTQTTGQMNMQSTASLSGFTGITGTSNSIRLNSATQSMAGYSVANFPSGFTINGTGNFTAPSGTMSVGGIFDNATGTFTHNGGTVNFNGSTASFICNNQAFNLVTFTGQTGVKTVGATCSLPLGNNPTIPNGITLNGTLSGTGTITQTTGALTMNAGSSISGFTGLTGTTNTLTVSGATANFSTYTTAFAESSVSLSSGTLTLPAGAIISGTFTQTGGTLATTTGDLTFGGTFSLSVGTFNAPTGTLNLGGNLTFTGTPTFTHNSGTINLTGASPTLSCVSLTFNKFTLNHSGTLTVSSNCTIPLGAAPTIPASVTNSGTMSGTGTVTMSSGTLTLASGSTWSGFTGFNGSILTINGPTASWGSYTTFSTTGLITVSSGTLTLPGGATIGNGLTLSGGNLGATTGDITITGAVTMSGAGTLTAPSGTLYISGNFVHTTGTFTHNSGTVNFNGASQTISGGTTVFNNFTKVLPTAAAATLTFPSTVAESVVGTLTLQGFDTTARLSLRASTNGSQWRINPSATRSVLYLDVKDGFNTNVTPIEMGGTGSIDSTNNTNFNFNSLTPNDPSTLGPSNVISAIIVPTSQPQFTFNSTDPNPLDTVKHQIQISQNSDFSSPVVDYTSGLSTQGSKSFTVGQAAGTGTYAVGSSGQTLTTGNYYWRVRTFDSSGLNSNYVAGNGGLMAFIIDADAPAIFTPTLDVTSPTNNQTPTLTFSTTDNVAVDHYQVKVDGSSFVTRTSPYVLPSLAQGAHTITVRAYDTSNNTRDGVVNITVDLSLPNIFTPTLNVTSPSNNQTPTLTFSTTDNDGIDHYEVQIDSGSFSTQTSPYLLPTLSGGAHTFTVRAFDTSGNTRDGSASLTVDITAPADFTPLLNVSSPTTNARPTVTFSTTDNLAIATYEVKVDSGSYSVQSSPYQVPTLSVGAHTITVRATDTAGNTTTGWVDVTVQDQTSPAAFSPLLSVTSPSNNQTPTLSFSTTDDIGIDHYEVQIDGGSFVTQTSPYSLPTLSVGSHTFVVRAFDGSGNSTDGSVSLVIDLTNPNAFTPTFNRTSPTNDNTPDLSFSTTDNISMGHYEIKVDSGSFVSHASPYGIPTLADGTHTITVRAFDSAGNYTDGSNTITVDTVVPASFTPTLDVSSPTAQVRPTVTFSTTDDVAIDHYQVRVDGGSFSTQTSPYQVPTLAEGAHTITVRAYDTAGNTRDGAVNITVDLNGPAAFTPQLNVTSPTANTAPILTFTTTDDTGIDHYEVKVDAGSFSTQSSPYQLPTLSSGAHTITVKAFDTTGNTTNGTVSVTIDLAGPVITYSSPTMIRNVDITNTTIRAVDTAGVLAADVTATGAVLNCTQTNATRVDCTSVVSASGTINITATDALGNESTQAISGYIIETTPPVIQITAPTKSSLTAITNTTIRVTDNLILDVSNVVAISGGTINCSQTTSTQVDCTSRVSVTGDLVINAADVAGNAAALTETGYSITNAPPLSFTPTLNTGSVTTNPAPILFFATTDSDGIDRYEVQIDGGSFSVQVSPYQLPTLSNGAHTILVRAYDVIGNYTDGTTSVTVNAASPSPSPSPSATPTPSPSPTPDPTPSPTVQNSSENSASSVSDSTHISDTCAYPVPAKAPELFQVTLKNGKAQLFITPQTMNVTSYVISYGETDPADQYATSFEVTSSDGEVYFEINDLQRSKPYYFKVMSKNNCAPSEWSETKKAGVATAKKSKPTVGSTATPSIEPSAIPKTQPESVPTLSPTVKKQTPKGNTFQNIAGLTATASFLLFCLAGGLYFFKKQR